MRRGKATAIAGANIAFTKYWGHRAGAVNLPLNDSVGLTLDNLTTRTTVEFRDDLKEDALTINGHEQSGKPLQRARAFLGEVRRRAGAPPDLHARVASLNSFSAATGLASSASAFAALGGAAFAALGVKLTPAELSTYARLGSGSAARSVVGGYVEWKTADSHEASAAHMLAPPEHWDLRDVALVVSTEEKTVKSAEGHGSALTSPFNDARVRAVDEFLPRVRQAIRDRDLATLGECMEKDALLMHGVMMTSTPSLVYWSPETVRGIHAVRRWREEEHLPVYFTIDAGPNLHLFCEAADAEEVARRAQQELGLPKNQVIVNGPGPGVRIVPQHVF